MQQLLHNNYTPLPLWSSESFNPIITSHVKDFLFHSSRLRFLLLLFFFSFSTVLSSPLLHFLLLPSPSPPFEKAFLSSRSTESTTPEWTSNAFNILENLIYSCGELLNTIFGKWWSWSSKTLLKQLLSDWFLPINIFENRIVIGDIWSTSQRGRGLTEEIHQSEGRFQKILFFIFGGPASSSIFPLLLYYLLLF